MTSPTFNSRFETAPATRGEVADGNWMPPLDSVRCTIAENPGLAIATAAAVGAALGLWIKR